MPESSIPGPLAIVLAAGASSRMGHPKALLALPSGTLLAEAQVHWLKEHGCSDALVVLGHDRERIAAALPRLRIVYHPHWERGRFSSVCAGLAAADHAAGYIILPVDTVGIRPSTLRAILNLARQKAPSVVRPTFNHQPGHLLWLSTQSRNELLALSHHTPDLRLDQWSAPLETRVEIDDPALLNNINTPQQWQDYLARPT
ncbi:MAG TPA: nucleotidyltransferase family protein [Kiritimatiellia bacterium]|nr:nucleotidyltransferase family protein [Kiritimatiellia bacterium]